MSKIDVLNLPTGQTLFKLSLPMIIGIIAIMAINLTDAYFLGQLGTEPLAAISFTFPIVFTLGSFSIGLGAGTSAVVSQAYGAGEFDKVKKLATHSLILAFLLVSLISSIGLFTIDWQFKSLGATEQTLPFIREYMEVWYFGLPLLVIPMIANSILRAGGDTTLPSLVMVLAAIINIILDPLFIQGGLGIPAFGMKGAAIASVIARFSTLVISLGLVGIKEKLISFERIRFSEMLSSWKAVLSVGIFAALGNMLNPIATGFITGFVANYGTIAVAGYGVATRIEAFLCIPLLALSAAISPFAGQNFGAKKMDRLKQAFQMSAVFSLLWSLLIGFLCLIGSPVIAGVFSREPQVIEFAANYLNWTSFSAVGYGILVIFASGYNAMGRSQIGLLLYGIRNFLVLIPVTYFCSVYFSTRGLFIGIMGANFLVALVFFLLSRELFKKLFVKSHTP